MASAEPGHLAKVASTALGQPAVVASNAPAPSKKRKLDTDAGPGAADDGEQPNDSGGKGEASLNGATAAMTKLDKGKAKKRRKEEQRALVGSTGLGRDMR